MFDFVFCTDKNYLKGYGVLMLSILHFMPDSSMRFHVLIDDLDEADKETLKNIASQNKACEARFYSPANALNKEMLNMLDAAAKSIKKHITTPAYYRLFIADLLPPDIHRALYLDGDIVCTGSLEELFKTDLKGTPCGMCLDGDTSHIWTYNRLGYPPSEGYFNSGVMLIDLDIWRKENLKAAMLGWLSLNAKKREFHDQDVINACLHGRIFSLDFSYNLQPVSLFVFYWLEEEKNDYLAHDEQYILKDRWDDLRAAVEKPRLVHIWGKLKPWHRDCDNPFAPVWRYFYLMSPWKDEPLKCRNTPSLKKKIKMRIRKLFEKMHLVEAKKRQEIPYPEEAFMVASAILDRLVAEDERSGAS